MKFCSIWSCALGLLVTGCGTSSWQDYSSTAGKFTVQFPDKPREKEETHFGVTARIVVLEQKDRTFSVTYADLTPEQVARLSLDDYAEGSIEGVKGSTKTGQETIKLGDHLGRDVRADLLDSKELRNRIYQVKNRIYHLTVVGKKGFGSSAEAEKFFNSFRLTN